MNFLRVFSTLLVSGEIVVFITVYFLMEHTKLFQFKDDILWKVAPLTALVTIIALAIPLVWWSNSVISESVDRRREAENAQKKLQILIDQRARFMAYVSHEIRNPLNGIMGIIGSINVNNLSDVDIEKHKAIEASSEDLLSILNDILDLSKVDSGEIMLNPSLNNLHEMVNSLVSFWQPRASDQNIGVKVEICPTFPEWVNIDAFRFRQIANNLVSNAIKYTETGFIKIEAQCDFVNKLGIISVQDTGRGIPFELKDAIFDQYVQVPEAGTLSRKIGTGLGLPIARQLARQMGGDVWLDSTSPNGSVFKFSMQLEPQDPPVQTEIEQVVLSEIEEGLKALVVDDVKTNCIVAREMLVQLGFHVTIATSGGEAIKHAITSQFDLVLLDDQLGDMTGSDVIFKSKPMQDHAKYVAYTGSILDEDKERFVKMGMHGFIPKPVNIEAFAAEIKRVLAN